MALSNIQTLKTTPGTYVFTPTVSGTATLILKAGGGGGGGSVVPECGSNTSGGGGGGGGGGASISTVTLQAGVTYTCIIGTGGSAGVQASGSPGGDTSLTGGGINLVVYGGDGGAYSYYGIGGNGGNGGAPNGGGGGGGGGGNNGFGPNNSTSGGSGGAGASQGSAGGAGGDCQCAYGAGGGGGGGAGSTTALGLNGSNSNMNSLASGGSGGQPAQSFDQQLTNGWGSNGLSANNGGEGAGGGGGGAAVISNSDTAGMGGIGMISGVRYSTNGQDGLVCIYFQEALSLVTPPEITSFTPLTGGGGTTITISGINFSPVASQNQVALGEDQPLSIISATSSKIVVLLPASLKASASLLKVVTNGAASNWSEQSFIYYGVPAITSISPNPVGLQQLITITGLFNNELENITFANCFFTISGGTTQVSISPPFTNELQVLVPVKAVSGPVYVRTDGGKSNSLNLNIQPIPIIGNQNSKVIRAGNTLTLTGKFFVTTNANVSVYFPGAGNVAPTSASDNQIAVVVPVNAFSGLIYVTVNGIQSNNYLVTIVAPITINSFAPAQVKQGDIVTVVGGNFSNYDTYTFEFPGLPSLKATVIDQWTLSITINFEDWSGNLRLISSTGVGATSTESLSISPLADPPMLTNISPTTGVEGTEVTLTGSNFSAIPEENSVMFGNLLGLVMSATNTTIVVQAPPPSISGSSVLLQVITNDKSSNVSLQHFRYLQIPVIKEFVPNIVGAGASLRFYFQGASNATFVDCYFDMPSGISKVLARLVAKGQGIVQVPTSASTGPFYIATDDGQSATVTLQIQPKPIIASVSKNPVNIGDVITITGENFIDGSTSVYFSGILYNDNIQIESSTVITMTIATGAMSSNLTIFVNGVISNQIVITVNT